MGLPFPGVRSVCLVLVKHRRLLMEMARRDISDRYSGEILGSIWAFIHPLATTAVYIFLFGVVFRTKVHITAGVPADQAIYMLSGLVPWLVTAEVFARGPGMITGQAALVKQVVFPLEVLPVKMVIATLPVLLIGLSGLIAYVFIAFGRGSFAYLLFPLAALLLYLFLLGIAFLLSALGVFLRDIKDLVQLYLLIGLYLAPIFYFMTWVPKVARPLIYINPLTVFVECFHQAGYYGGITDVRIWLIAAGLSIVSLLLGVTIFHRLKPQFGSFV